MDKLFAMVIASDGSGRRVWVVATCARIAEYDFVADVSRKFAEEAARCIALRRTLSAPGNHRAISNFVLRARRLPGSLEELAQVLADDRIRKILLGTDEIAAPGQVAVEDAPPPPDPPKRRGSQSDSPGAIEDVEVGDE
jgi:hypothetical protein